MDLVLKHIMNWLLSPETITFLIGTITAFMKQNSKNNELKAEKEIRKIVMCESQRVDNKQVSGNIKKDIVKQAIKTITKDKKIDKYLNNKMVDEVIESVYHGYIKNGLFKELNKK